MVLLSDWSRLRWNASADFAISRAENERKRLNSKEMFDEDRVGTRHVPSLSTSRTPCVLQWRERPCWRTPSSWSREQERIRGGCRDGFKQPRQRVRGRLHAATLWFKDRRHEDYREPQVVRSSWCDAPNRNAPLAYIPARSNRLPHSSSLEMNACSSQ
ncbi:uncharacterized protein BKA78DRAFT_328673 [Phyllosticta capitalensis]|uniref:uncharacterized protein n=1 Tax=Phyllosticta capitalensis TaxID=121624 RepID=UPI003131DB2C